MPVPPMRGHLPCRDTFAWIQKCPFKAGTTERGIDPSAATRETKVEQVVLVVELLLTSQTTICIPSPLYINKLILIIGKNVPDKNTRWLSKGRNE